MRTTASLITSTTTTFETTFDNTNTCSSGGSTKFPFNFTKDWSSTSLTNTTVGNKRSINSTEKKATNNIFQSDTNSKNTMEGGNSNGQQNNFHHGKIITKELEDVVVGIEGALAGDAAPSEETIAELQLQTARKLRQVSFLKFIEEKLLVYVDRWNAKFQIHSCDLFY